MESDITEGIDRFDSHGFYRILADFPHQCGQGLEIGRKAEIGLLETGRINNIVVAGMGGSAIGGDILRSYITGELSVPLIVNRGYTLPAFTGPDTLVIISSYSGETEETLSAFNDAIKRDAQCVAMTSGGTLLDRAAEQGITLIRIPGGLAPRCALGYSFFPLLVILIRLGCLAGRDMEIVETLDALRSAVREYTSIDGLSPNRALDIAREIHGYLPIIYSPQDHLEAVNLRWRCQLEENAKILSFGNTFPELNHNEIAGWEQLPALHEQMVLILLRDKEDHPRIAGRIDVTRRMLEPVVARVIECSVPGTTLLARLFGLICLGDWISFFSAILNDIDPFYIRKIDALKSELLNRP